MESDNDVFGDSDSDAELVNELVDDNEDLDLHLSSSESEEDEDFDIANLKWIDGKYM